MPIQVLRSRSDPPPAAAVQAERRRARIARALLRLDAPRLLLVLELAEILAERGPPSDSAA